MITLANAFSCTGCKACGDACPTGAIKFAADKKGFWHPVIDRALCVECERCEKVCIVLKANQSDLQKDMPSVFSAYSREVSIREKSTSGGMFYELSSYVIHNGGVACGCRFSEDYRSAYHSFAETMEELEPMLSSKYFQSETSGIYRKIQDFLQEGRRVLFCGAPCQSAALQQYLPDSLQGGLLTVDFVCLGINSPMGYEKFIDELEERYGSKVKKVRFKDKSRGWHNLGTKIMFQNGKEYYGNRFTDAWVNSFIGGKFMIRSSCAECQFKELPRVSDITIGDFWGGDYTADERKNGISLVMLNSQKGKKVFNEVSRLLIFKEADLGDAQAGNKNIDHQVSLDFAQQDEFFNRLENERFSKTVWSMLRRPAWNRYAAWWLYVLRNSAKYAIFKKY